MEALRTEHRGNRGTDAGHYPPLTTSHTLSHGPQAALLLPQGVNSFHEATAEWGGWEGVRAAEGSTGGGV